RYRALLRFVTFSSHARHPDMPDGVVFVFFLMIRRPPRSTLFPYNDALPISADCPGPCCQCCKMAEDRAILQHWQHRSEEHTSELQSLTNLVCRLLLEKK